MDTRCSWRPVRSLCKIRCSTKSCPTTRQKIFGCWRWSPICPLSWRCIRRCRRKTVAEFVAYAKQNPGKLNFGSAGTGGTIHLAGEMFKQMAGIEMTHVPYKGAGPALTDLLSGNIQVMFDSLSTALPPVKSGLLRPLGISSAQRSPDLPDVPTIAESGYPNYTVSVWYGIAAPSKLPDDVAQKISASLDRALNDDVFRASLEKIGFPVFRPRGAAAIQEFIDADRARWSAVIKAQNISLD
ncbi:MAG TPA: tripartite tricarboxylate transporter substrate binding protein [Bradyrhizobium sp.]